MKKSKIIGILILVFICSLLIRIPNLDRPLSKHHEFITAVSLRVLQVWDKNPPSSYHYAPVMNYPGEANKWINNHASPTGTMVDDKGNYYYISHPPFAFLLPHYSFKLLHVKPTVLSLQLFLIFCSLLTGIFVYLIALYVGTHKEIEKRKQLGVIAFTLYMLSPAVLWFQGNTYMSDILVHMFFVSTIYYFIRATQSKEELKWMLLFCASLLLMIYTSWLGVFVAFCITMFGLIKWKLFKFRKMLLPTSIVTILTLVLIVSQYSSINGFDNFMSQLFQRLDVRGSASSENTDPFLLSKLKEFGLLFMNYGILFFPIFMLLIYGYFKQKTSITSINKTFLFISIVPIIILHLALLNYSGHDFTSLYASIVLSILGGTILLKLSKVKSTFALTVILVFNIGSYYFVNRPGTHSWKGDLYATSMNEGLAIKEIAEEDKTIFYLTNGLDPMVIVYAERNIVPVRDESEIEQYLEELKVKDWQFIRLDK